MVRLATAFALLFVTGCATSANLGALQHAPGDGTGASLNGHWGFGAVPDKILTLDFDARGDVAERGSRFALGGSVQAGLPIVGQYKLLARAGIWHALASNTEERSVVPTFELAGFIPLRTSFDPAKPIYGGVTSGIVVGVREDLDVFSYTTVFVGLALYMVPGY